MTCTDCGAETDGIHDELGTVLCLGCWAESAKDIIRTPEDWLFLLMAVEEAWAVEPHDTITGDVDTLRERKIDVMRRFESAVRRRYSPIEAR